MSRNTTRKSILMGSTAVLFAAAFMAAPAMAQDGTAAGTQSVPGASLGGRGAEQPATDVGGDIVVTGTRIRRPNLESNSPITVVDDKEFQYQGSTAVENTLNRLPQFTADANENGSNGSDGTANINLRDLGSNRVLVLLNGQRLLPSQAIDLNFVPSSLVERVDVVSGGASAVYGSDAVSGVVNFILKDNLEGIRLDSTYSFFQHDNDDRLLRTLVHESGYERAPKHVADGDKYQINLAAGTNFAEGRGNVTAYFGYRHADPVLQGSRDYSACALDPADEMGATRLCGGSSNNEYGLFTLLTGPNAGQTLNNTKDGAKTWVPYNSSFAYNYGPTNYIQRSDVRYTAGAFTHYEFSDAATLYGSFMFMDDHTFSQAAESALFQGTVFHINCDNPFLGPQQANLLCGSEAGTATDADVFIGYRPTTEGSQPRRDDLRHTDYRFTGGLRGEVMEGINYDVSALRSVVIYDESYKNDISNAKAQNALQVVNVNGVPTCRSVIDGSDPDCVPLDVFGYNNIDPAAYGYIYAPTFTHGVTKELVLNGTLSGDLGSYGISSPWATQGLGFALGVEHRREDLRFEADELAQSKGTNNAFGIIKVDEVYTELELPVLQNLPFAKALSINGGFRYSRYQNEAEDGTTTRYNASTYKVELNYAPVSDIRFRGSYNRAIRAPNINELFAPQGLGNVAAQDPCSGADPAASFDACAASGVTQAQYGHIPECPAAFCVSQFGGNPELKPEKADTYTFGTVITPSFVPNLSLSVDYYNIKVKNYIASVDATLIINQCIQTGNPFFCDLFHRDPRTGVLFGNDGYVVATTLNTGFLKTDGIDVTANYGLPLENIGMGAIGRLNFDFVGSYLHKQITEPLPDLGTYDCAGLFGPTCGQPAPHWRHTLRTTWVMPWSDATVSVNWRYIGSTDLTNNQDNEFLAGTPYVLNSRIKAYSYFDLAATVRLFKDISFRAGINNILDKDPPAIFEGLNSAFGNGNTFPGVYDPLGRMVFAGFTANF